MTKNVVIIGAGSAKGQDYIAALLERTKEAKIVAIVINKTMPEKVAQWAEKYHWKVIREGNVQELLASTSFDTAIVALPHDQHHLVTKTLLQANIRIIKEKPLAMTLNQAREYASIIAEKKATPIFTTVQRSTHPLFVEAKNDLQTLGAPLSFTYIYTFDLTSQTSGWRADPLKSGGGVVLDMGYHALDVVNDLFGVPERVMATFSYKYPQMQANNLEDASCISLNYKGMTGQVLLDRHASKREECLTIVTSEGKIVLTPSRYELYRGDKCIKEIDLPLSKQQLIQKMFDLCFRDDLTEANMAMQFQRHLQTMQIIDTIYSQK